LSQYGPKPGCINGEVISSPFLNSSGKTGCIRLILDDAEAIIQFKEGELIRVRYRELQDKKALFPYRTISCFFQRKFLIRHLSSELPFFLNRVSIIG